MKYEDAIVWASGFYLCEHLPTDWIDWDDEKLYSYIKEYAWEPFEHYDAPTVFEYIGQLAESVQQLIQKEEV